MKLQIHRRLAGILLMSALVALLPAAINADIVGQKIDAHNWSFVVTGMPDFDQRRGADSANNILGLPKNGGMYCVPTSTMNVLAYIANHGYSLMEPQLHNWLGSPQHDLYNLATAEISILGAQMFTDPAKGTDGANALLATQLWLDFFAPGQFAITQDYAHGNYCPRYKDFAPLTIQGSLIMLGLGNYPGLNDGSTKVLRQGGHATVLVYGAHSSHSNSDKYEIGMNDPASDEGGDPLRLVRQTPFVTDYWWGLDTKIQWGYKDAGGTIHYNTRTQTQFMDTFNRAIDSYVAITPKYGLTARDNSIIWWTPSKLIGLDLPTSKTIKVDGRVLDLAINPTRAEHPYIVEGVNAVMLFDTLTGESTRFVDLDRPRHLTMGGKELYTFVATADKLIRVHPDGSSKAAPLRSPLDAVAFDEGRNRLVGVSVGEGKLRIFDAGLNIVGNFALPGGVLDGGGSVDLGFSEGDGSVYLHCGGSRRVTRIAFSESGRPMFVPIDLNCGGSPQGFFVDEKGNLFLACDGVARVFTNRGAIWENAPLAGMPAGSKLQVLKPFSNYDPAYTDSPSFFNIDPANWIP